MALIEPPIPPAPPEPEEAVLLRAAFAGDAGAWEALLRRCRRTAYLFALQLTGDPDEALDAAQESLLRLFRHRGRFDPARPLRPWLLKIVRNTVADSRRRDAVRRRAAETVLAAGGGRSPEDPHGEAERQETRRMVWEALGELDAAAREILILREYHDLPYREIAEVLGIPVGTVMSRLHAARALMARHLRRRMKGVGHA
jgi:RNA polymerase sigma-70 factor (ECF subfamily)